ncbi:Superoxide-generating NADPH oxidase heavy chain subunit B [Zancudomyces culisetae]|uniref:Superoxide-generating NADPH oxidase heavy chain subunit B n=1 Tax=Zancudomyces culisetae TaxID=1213189 RepID=A0A1R1PDR5_ZANCU|nr:Superoxide-generating NADPH oxidase heavy chain subunit B [Zancudomyces culisetae]|eukprot:OMH79117.1 Superoxide-generating NADPH oxidase heavy chain subunit B [Zancudomyces culisetae]
MNILRKFILDRMSRLLKPSTRKKWLFFSGWRTIRMENTLSLHLLFTLGFVFWSVLHSALGVYRYYNPTIIITYPGAGKAGFDPHLAALDGLLSIRSGTGPGEPIVTVKRVRYKYFVTGLIDMSILFVLVLFTLPPIRRRFYELFYYTHHLFYAVVVATLLHVKISDNKVWVPGVAIYVIDKLYRMTKVQLSNKEPISVKDWTASTYEIRVKPTERIKRMLTYGQYVHINCPEISKLEWHPFDIANIKGDEYLNIYIKKDGKWTQQLYNLLFDNGASTTSSLSEQGRVEVTDKALESFSDEVDLGLSNADGIKPKRIILTDKISIGITGCYESIYKYAFENQVIALIATGTGIATNASIIRYFLARPEKVKTKKIYLVWSYREPETIGMLYDLIKSISDKQLWNSSIFFYIYCTKKADESFEKVVISEFLTNQIKYTIGERPNYKSILRSIADDNANSTVGVTFVGNRATQRSVSRKCNAVNRTRSVTAKINFYHEYYN